MGPCLGCNRFKSNSVVCLIRLMQPWFLGSTYEDVMMFQQEEEQHFGDYRRSRCILFGHYCFPFPVLTRQEEKKTMASLFP